VTGIYTVFALHLANGLVSNTIPVKHLDNPSRGQMLPTVVEKWLSVGTRNSSDTRPVDNLLRSWSMRGMSKLLTHTGPVGTTLRSRKAPHVVPRHFESVDQHEESISVPNRRCVHAQPLRCQSRSHSD